MKLCLFSVPILLTVAAPAQAAEIDDLADAIRPQAKEALWRTIPWCRTPDEAWEIAKKENRPIFVWTSAGPPFERC